MADDTEPKHPSMQEYELRVRGWAQEKMDEKSPAERIVYAQQLSMMRDAAKYSGIPEWTEAHVTGAMFASSAIETSLQMLHKLGVFDHDVTELLTRLVREQAIIAVEM